MANCCEFHIQAVSKDKASLERLLSIMKYEDKEFYINRVMDVYPDGVVHMDEDSGLWRLYLYGYVGWSAYAWVHGVPMPDMKCDTGAGYTNLREVCRLLGIAVEIWTRESGMCFQEYIHIDNNGNVVSYETEKWMLNYDEKGNEIEDGGFDDFGSWQLPKEIYR
jgi:hypothetical protein